MDGHDGHGGHGGHGGHSATEIDRLESLLGRPKMLQARMAAVHHDISPIEAVLGGYMDIRTWNNAGTTYSNLVLDSLLRMQECLDGGDAGLADWYGMMTDVLFDYYMMWSLGYTGPARAPVSTGWGS
ncbi:MAG: hypothetical protein MPJ25_01485 [Pirellulales bacterium]|nr:hypothetical protein [Pirellulales bacterium]